MVLKIRFDKALYEYLLSTRSTQVLRSRVFRLSNRTDQLAYQHLISNFKKWVFYYKPYEFNGSNVNEIYFDFERMLAEYSLHYGIKSGEEIVNEGAMKPSTSKVTKSIETFIEDSLKGLEEHIQKTTDSDVVNAINDIRTWRKSFMINCVPNILHGNYVNVPSQYVETEQIMDVVRFESDEKYFFEYLNRVPLTINKIIIGDEEFFNIVNTSIVPLFLSMDTDYILGKE